MNRSGLLTGGIENRGSNARNFYRAAGIFNFCGDSDRGRSGADLGSDKGAPRSDVDRVGLHEPYVAINSSTFVKPTLIFGGVRSDDENIRAAVIQEIGDVKSEGGVAAEISAKIETVECDDGVAEYTVEFDGEAAAFVIGGDIEGTAIPADARLGINAAERARPMREQIVDVFLNGQLHGKIMGQVEKTPRGVIEGFPGCGKQETGFCELCVFAETEILVRIVGIAQMEAPTEIEEQALTASRAGGLGTLRQIIGGGRHAVTTYGIRRMRRDSACRGGSDYAHFQNVTPGPIFHGARFYRR